MKQHSLTEIRSRGCFRVTALAALFSAVFGCSSDGTEPVDRRSELARARASTTDLAARSGGFSHHDAAFLPVTLPAGIEREDVLDSPAWVRAELRHAALDAARASGLGLDAIVFVDREGRPILPDAEARDRERSTGLKSLAENDLTFTYEPTGVPWQPGEQEEVEGWIEACYPHIKDIYGSPAFANVVNVSRADTGQYAGFYFTATNEILIGNFSGVSTTCHEVVHAFHDDYIFWMSIWEEAMTVAGEIETLKRAGIPNPAGDHGYMYNVMYEALNRPAVGGKYGNFGSFGNQWSQRLMRYQLGGYAWAKPMFEEATFLADFNSAMYAAAAEDVSVLNSPSELIAIAATIKPTVEGIPTATWFAGQHVLGTTPPEGNILYLRTSSPSEYVSVFERTVSGEELNLANVPVSYTVSNAAGVVVSTGSITTNLFGVEQLPGFERTAQRYRLSASATVDGAQISASEYFPGVVGEGVFGIVQGADAGSVTLSPLDDGTPPVTVAVSQGWFEAPTLRAVRGRVSVAFAPSSGSGSATRIFTKDGDVPYYVVVEFTAPPASTPCGGLCQNPVTFSGSYGASNLGTGATCHETTSNLAGGLCGGFASSRTFSVNGTPVSCSGIAYPPKRNGGYCLQASAGNEPWAWFSVW
jgi:hypothetical protein